MEKGRKELPELDREMVMTAAAGIMKIASLLRTRVDRLRRSEKKKELEGKGGGSGKESDDGKHDGSQLQT